MDRLGRSNSLWQWPAWPGPKEKDRAHHCVSQSTVPFHWGPAGSPRWPCCCQLFTHTSFPSAALLVQSRQVPLRWMLAPLHPSHPQVLWTLLAVQGTVAADFWPKRVCSRAGRGSAGLPRAPLHRERLRVFLLPLEVLSSWPRLGSSSTSTGLSTLSPLYRGATSCVVPAGSSSKESWHRDGPSSPANHPGNLGAQGEPLPGQCLLLRHHTGPGLQEGAEGAQGREEELLLVRERRAPRMGREATGAHGDRHSLPNASTLALQRTRGLRPCCSPAALAGSMGSPPSSAEGEGCCPV